MLRDVGKQVRAFNLDNDVSVAIDHEAGIGGNKSALVNELLKEALEARSAHRRKVGRVAVEFAQATATMMVTLAIFALTVTFLG